MLISELISMHGISYVLFNYVSSQAVEIKCTLDSFFFISFGQLNFSAHKLYHNKLSVEQCPQI